MKPNFAWIATLISTLVSPLPGHSQTAPDAGALRQQIERDQGTPLPRQVLPTPATSPEAINSLPGDRVTMTSVRFVGNTLLSSAQLAPAVQAYLHQPQNFSQLQEAATAVTQTYRNAGWLVRAYLPKQDVTDGVLTIQIVEAVFSGASVSGTEPLRLKFSQVLGIFQTQHPTGQPVNTDALDRALLLTDDLPGVAVSGALYPGDNEGETGISLKISDEPLLMGEVSVDNTGARSTGADRLNASLLVNSPLGQGDQLAVNMTYTEGSNYVRAAYSAPVGDDGWRIGANASQLSYKLVAPEFAVLRGQGQSGSYGLEATYPWIRSRNRNLFLTLGYDKKSFRNESNAAVQSEYDNSNVTLGLSGNSYDDWGGGGSNSGSIALVAGDIALGDLQPGENAARQGGFGKLRYALSRQQVLRNDWTVLGALSGQQADKTLDSSEKITLGGANGVRAYPSGEGSGSSGQLLALELRWRVSQGLNLTGFYDWGNVNNNDGSLNHSLQGAGLGLAWRTPVGATLKAVWAQRIGDNPNVTPAGTDQDGTLKRDRWWLTASMPF